MNSSYYLTANPYAADGTYLADRTAINSKTTITAAYATLIRNAGGNMYAEISNAETGEVYKTVQKGRNMAHSTTPVPEPGPIRSPAPPLAGV